MQQKISPDISKEKATISYRHKERDLFSPSLPQAIPPSERQKRLFRPRKNL